MAIWIVKWDTESGDHGIEGYWTSKPTKKQLNLYMADRFPCDFEAKTLYYELIQLSQIEGIL